MQTYGKKFGYRKMQFPVKVSDFSKEAQRDYYTKCGQVLIEYQKLTFSAEKNYAEVIKELDAAKSVALDRCYMDLLANKGESNAS